MINRIFYNNLIRSKNRALIICCLAGLICLSFVMMYDGKISKQMFSVFLCRKIIPFSDGNQIFSHLKPIPYPKSTVSESETIMSNQSDLNNPTLILLWTKWRLWQWFWPDMSCLPFCSVTTNRSLANQSSAILFHASDVEWMDLPLHRRFHQYYVFVNWESPNSTYNDLSVGERRSFFNLTMTYRRDSDIFHPYGKIIMMQNNELKSIDLVKLIKGKQKMVASFMGHCHPPSRRDSFVDDLKKYLSVDVYGRCGTLTCGTETERLGWKSGLFDAQCCDQLLSTKYKFYLSLENSICRDYVTEKFYYTLDNSIIVPIVFERKIILNLISDDMASIFNHSFIAIDDFNYSAQKLAEYLKYLDSNLTAYMEYFKWRDHYHILLDQPGFNFISKPYPHPEFKPACDLCRVVREKKEHIIEDLNHWWVTEAACHSYF